VRSSITGSLTRKKFLVDRECMYWYVRSSSPTACPDWKPHDIPSHLLDVAAVVGRVVELGDLDVDVEVPLRSCCTSCTCEDIWGKYS